jgi:hypothetical protein
MYVIGVPSFPGVELPQAHLVVASLEDAAVLEVLGLRAAA